jgi:hypothetical protein
MITPALIAAATLALASQTDAEAADFAGLYINGFETSDFISCNGPTKGERLWRAGYGAREAEVIARWRKGRGPQAFPFLWIEFSGHLSRRGEWGHLGLYPHQVSVVSLKAVRVATDADVERCAMNPES